MFYGNIDVHFMRMTYEKGSKRVGSSGVVVVSSAVHLLVYS